MAYGTPRSPGEIEPYYTDIRRGRPPTDEQLADLVRRYEAIGGVSPLAQRTVAQRDALQRALDALAPDTYTVAIGLKHADPKIETTVEELAVTGIERIVAVVMAPHYSAGSVGQYLERTRAAAAPHDIDVVAIESWATEPAFVDFLAADVRRRLTSMPSNTKTLFTAHSLPARIIAGGDPYPDELNATAAAVAVGRRSRRDVGDRVAERRPHTRAMDRPRHPHRDRRSRRLGMRRGARRARAASSPITSRCCTTSTSRPASGRNPRARVRPHGLRQRRSGGDRRLGCAHARAGEPLMPASDGRRVLVVGGGITGLATAEALVAGAPRSSCARPARRWAARSEPRRSPAWRSTRAPTRSSPVRPRPSELAERVGVAGLTSPTDATAAVWHDGLHGIPGAIVLGVPAGLRPFVTTGLLSWRGKLRAACEPFLPRTSTSDDVLGSYVRRRFGDEVHERLVDALVGSIYATDTDNASLAAVPQLADLAAGGRSLLLTARRSRARATSQAAPGPIFGAPTGGVGALVDAVAAAVRAGGGEIRTSSPVATIERDGATWVVDDERFDAVALTSPARATAPLLTTVAPEAARACSAASSTPT